MAIDGKWLNDHWEVFVSGGTVPTGMDVVSWAHEAEDRGAGEILLTSIDHDGKQDGYDMGLTRTVAEAASIPVIASGGAGERERFHQILSDGKADAALAAGVFHYRQLRIREVKKYPSERGNSVRHVWVPTEQRQYGNAL